jgi:hypothetical protein
LTADHFNLVGDDEPFFTEQVGRAIMCDKGRYHTLKAPGRGFFLSISQLFGIEFSRALSLSARAKPMRDRAV